MEGAAIFQFSVQFHYYLIVASKLNNLDYMEDSEVGGTQTTGCSASLRQNISFHFMQKKKNFHILSKFCTGLIV